MFCTGINNSRLVLSPSKYDLDGDKTALEFSPFKSYFDGDNMPIVRTFGWVNSDKETVSVALCLDFANTVGNRLSAAPREYLQEFADLVRWCQEGELVTSGVAQSLLGQAKREPDKAAAILAEAREFREVIYRIFFARVKRKSLAADLQKFNLFLRSMPLFFEVRMEKNRLVRHQKSTYAGLAQLVAPVAWSAANLLASEVMVHVKQCGSEECGWLFVDTTKNHKRRWCDMSGCGCRAKARTYYRRKKRFGF
jgi:predicted RNA-binding Zn ribbon-like protein